MTKVAKSPDRYGFQKDAYIERAIENGKDLNDPHVQQMIKMHESSSDEKPRQKFHFQPLPTL